MTAKKSIYAEQFFGKMKPGKAFGDGFIGEVEKTRKEKPIKPFKPMIE